VRHAPRSANGGATPAASAIEIGDRRRHGTQRRPRRATGRERRSTGGERSATGGQRRTTG